MASTTLEFSYEGWGSVVQLHTVKFTRQEWEAQEFRSILVGGFEANEPVQYPWASWLRVDFKDDFSVHLVNRADLAQCVIASDVSKPTYEDGWRDFYSDTLCDYENAE
jgi:hypothetical protein